MKYLKMSKQIQSCGLSRAAMAAALVFTLMAGTPLTALAQNGNSDTNIFGQPVGADRMIDFAEVEREETNGGFHLAAELDPDELVAVSFNKVGIDEILIRLEELAGKPVKPSPNLNSGNLTLTLINSRQVRREDALNLLVSMLLEHNTPVIDRGTYLFVASDMNDIMRGSVPFINADTEILNRTDGGWVAEKAYLIRYGKAKNIASVLQESLPSSSKMGIDESSNQIHVLGNIGTLQRIQQEINSLDRVDSLQVETFTLKYADANSIGELIIGLYSAEEDSGSGAGGRSAQLFQPRGGRQPASGDAAMTQRLRVVVDKTHNSISVLAERAVLEQIAEQIATIWDVPVPADGIQPRIYNLVNRDAVQLRDLLREIFAPESGGDVGVFQADNRAGFRSTQSRRSSGGMGGAEQAQLNPLRGQVEIHADEEKNRLIVMTRSAEYYAVIDQMITDLDADKDPNLPQLILLKYADSEDLANRLNAMFAGGGDVSIQMQQQGLEDRGRASIVGGGTSGDSSSDSDESGELSLPWLQAQRDPDELPLSSVIGKVRIMPYPRQNGLLVLARPDQMKSIQNLIDRLDRPGRQVLIEAIVAEISEDSGLSLGVRWGSGSIFDGPNADNRLDLRGDVEGTKNNLIRSLFDSSVLGVNFNLNAALQALNETSKVRILSRPRLFTSDNEEAYLFDGQDVPFITDSQTTDQGSLNQSFDYLAVGIRLGVRPHITVEGSIDLRVNLELSSVVPGETLFGGSILDRRETETKVTIRDGETVVISGILREQENDLIRKIPLLGDLPLIGGLFRSTEKSRSQTQLVVFIRPIILDNPTEVRQTAEWHRQQLGTLGDQIDLNHPGYFNPPMEPDATDLNGSTDNTGSGSGTERFWWQDDSR